MSDFLLNERNEEVLTCKDKLYEILDKTKKGKISEFESEKMLDLLNERIENYEKLKLGLINFEEVILKDVEKSGEHDIKRYTNVKLRDLLVTINIIYFFD